MDEFRLETIAQLHAVSTDLFIPFVIHRLGGSSNQTEATLTVELRGVGDFGDALRQLRLNWDAASAPELPPGVPDATVTEWAALGIACTVLWYYGGLRLSAVSLRGDRFDYWVQREGPRLGLEVSGTIDESVEERHRQKVRQLRDNPYGVDGYVVVVGFAPLRMIFSFHRFAEGS